MDLDSVLQLLFLATVIILAHLWHRRWFPTAHVPHPPDAASDGPPPDTVVVSED